MPSFEVDPAISHIFLKVLFIGEFLRNVSEIDADIFRAVQWSLEIKVSGVKGELFCALAREDIFD